MDARRCGTNIASAGITTRNYCLRAERGLAQPSLPDTGAVTAVSTFQIALINTRHEKCLAVSAAVIRNGLRGRHAHPGTSQGGIQPEQQNCLQFHDAISS
jgi:hypothetical protein